MIDRNFYRAFEDRHRGPRELIKSRLRIYLPFVEQLKAIYAECKVVDLGCGRGEWLELMAVCQKCGALARHSERVKGKKDQIVVGAREYIAVCEICHRIYR